MAAASDKDKSKVHKLSLKGSAKLVAEFVGLPCKVRKKQASEADQTGTVPVFDPHHIVRKGNRTCLRTCRLIGFRFQRGVYPAEDFTAYGVAPLLRRSRAVTNLLGPTASRNMA